jgi:hypothetical protein
MSQLKFNELQGTSNIVRVESPNVIYAPGHVIQVKWNLSMERFYYAIPDNDSGMRGSSFAEGSNQGGTIIRPLDITIIPKSVNSWIHVEFNMFFEANHNQVFSILRDGQLIGAGFQDGGADGRYVGAGVARYDANDDSTPAYLHLPWIDRPGTTSAVTYSIAAKNSAGSNQSLTLNSTIANYQFGADAYEQGCSFSIAQEIAY